MASVRLSAFLTQSCHEESDDFFRHIFSNKIKIVTDKQVSMMVSQLVLNRDLPFLGDSEDGTKSWNNNGLDEMASPLHFVALGDVHGEVDKVSSGISDWNRRHSRRPISRALQVGDFEAIRDRSDLTSVVGPAQHRKMGDYPRFHEGTEVFPVPLHFIGGNHEAHAFLEGIPSGGQLAPNIFYGGRVLTLSFNGIRAVGLSGIYNPGVFETGRPENLPVEAGDGARNWRPWTCFTKEEWELVRDQAQGAQILMLHDWPAHLSELLDPYTIRGNSGGKAQKAGNEPAFRLLSELQPDLLICGHHHHFLSGRIYWQTGKVTQVLCLDNFDGDKKVGPANMAVIEMSRRGLRVLDDDVPKLQTPEMEALRTKMRPQDQEFSYALYTGEEKDSFKERIAALKEGIVWQDDSFVIGGFRFTLRENKKTAFVDDLDGDPTYFLTVVPVLDSRHIVVERLIGMAKQMLTRLRMICRVDLLSSFNDQIF